ncbi:MAG: hypothetical protein V1670_02315 [Candidatus Omnitrophota bacterium]
MKKILLAALGIFFFTVVCFAQDHYALVEVMIKNDTGLTYAMNTITKVSNPESCQKILSPLNQLKGMYSIRTECVSGPEWNKLLADTFANKATSAIYISYIDSNGYETRINVKVLTDSSSAVLVLPKDPPLEETKLWAKAMIETLEKGGIKSAKIIYPVKK